MQKSFEEVTSMKQNDQRETEKKPYAAPKLVEYGNITKLTQSGLTGASDGLLPMNCL